MGRYSKCLDQAEDARKVDLSFLLKEGYLNKHSWSKGVLYHGPEMALLEAL
jgi:hypothetical protein